MAFIKEFLVFLKQRKKLWMIPLIIILGLLAVLLIATQNPIVAPFIYTLF
jgi:hypothetical protein